MITQDREPINKDARRALSSGDPSRVKTVEEAISIAGVIIASPNNIKQVRQMIETGNVVKYQITIKKNIIIDSSEVQLSSEVNNILCDLSDSITLSKTIFSLGGWDVAEAFDSYRPDGTDEIDRDSLFEFITGLQDTLSLPDDVKNDILDDTKRDWIFFTVHESY